MYSLIVDSSTKILYIALVNDNDVIYEKYVEGKNDHAKNIVYLIDEALNHTNITANLLDNIICGNGPGSYTGVRMAVTVCKMLAIFTKKPLYTISTLKLMASGFNGKVLATIDARRGNVFGCIIDNINDKMVVEEGLYPYEIIKGNDYVYSVNEGDYKVDPIYCIKHKEYVAEPHLLVPNYLRETEAERNIHD
ncbi:MAG: tRNA (adenosine(37)-N6)-threonylcarbamoyltransferase complex dimerization subunit type 1 TsaB [Anaeroplasma sp.]